MDESAVSFLKNMATDILENSDVPALNFTVNKDSGKQIGAFLFACYTVDRIIDTFPDMPDYLKRALFYFRTKQLCSPFLHESVLTATTSEQAINYLYNVIKNNPYIDGLDIDREYADIMEKPSDEGVSFCRVGIAGLTVLIDDGKLSKYLKTEIARFKELADEEVYGRKRAENGNSGLPTKDVQILRMEDGKSYKICGDEYPYSITISKKFLKFLIDYDRLNDSEISELMQMLYYQGEDSDGTYDFEQLQNTNGFYRYHFDIYNHVICWHVDYALTRNTCTVSLRKAILEDITEQSLNCFLNSDKRGAQTGTGTKKQLKDTEKQPVGSGETIAGVFSKGYLTLDNEVYDKADIDKITKRYPHGTHGQNPFVEDCKTYTIQKINNVCGIPVHSDVQVEYSPKTHFIMDVIFQVTSEDSNRVAKILEDSHELTTKPDHYKMPTGNAVDYNLRGGRKITVAKDYVCLIWR